MKTQKTYADFLAEYKAGTFDPEEWNWCIAPNSVLKDGKYETRTCLFIMGPGAEQCLVHFVGKGEGPAFEEALIAKVKRDFGVDYVQRGVG